jgi:U6 snRNA-associated Sm-like protein LSm6
MNIALEKTEEHVDGVKKRSYGDAFVRGNNGEAQSGCGHAPSNSL